MIKAHTKSADDTRAMAAELAALCRPGDVILLAGDLGAGKTAFAQGFGRALKVEEPITSPTFVIMRRYQSDPPLVHIDAYRLDHLQEIIDLGIAEILDEAVVLVEWGDVVAPVLPADFLVVRLEFGSDDDERLITIRAVGAHWNAKSNAVRGALGRWSSEGT